MTLPDKPTPGLLVPRSGPGYVTGSLLHSDHCPHQGALSVSWRQAAVCTLPSTLSVHALPTLPQPAPPHTLHSKQSSRDCFSKTVGYWLFSFTATPVGEDEETNVSLVRKLYLLSFASEVDQCVWVCVCVDNALSHNPGTGLHTTPK